jgi:hypothetical protein
VIERNLTHLGLPGQRLGAGAWADAAESSLSEAHALPFERPSA